MKVSISTSTEMANAVLRDTPQAYEQNTSAEEKANDYVFASQELRDEYIKGFNLSLDFIRGVRDFSK
jgi:shikimate 5-dehydrogenase